MATKRNRVGGRSNLIGSVELKRLIQQRRILVEPLLDEEQIDNIGIDLWLDCFFRELVRTTGGARTRTTGCTLLSKDGDLSYSSRTYNP